MTAGQSVLAVAALAAITLALTLALHGPGPGYRGRSDQPPTRRARRWEGAPLLALIAVGLLLGIAVSVIR